MLLLIPSVKIEEYKHVVLMQLSLQTGFPIIYCFLISEKSDFVKY